MRNTKQTKKLKLDKMTISKISNLNSIIGGTGCNGGGDGTEDRTMDQRTNRTQGK